MADILSITVPIFLIVGLGFGAVRLGILARGDIRALGLFVLNFAMPALIIRAVSQKALSELIDPHYLLGYTLASLAVFGLVYVIGRRQTPERPARAAFQALGASVSNSGFIGYPIAALALGPVGAIGFAHGLVIENLVMLPLGLALAEAAGQAGEPLRMVLGEVFRRLIRNPLIFALLIGAALSLLSLSLPLPLARTINLLANASAPVSLFVISGTLVGVKVRGMVQAVSLVAVGKLLLHPLAVLAAIWLFPPRDPALIKAMVIFSSVPMITIYPILGQKYGEAEFCAAALLVTTALSFITISAMLYVVV
jgi:malonate transporter and related proteins